MTTLTILPQEVSELANQVSNTKQQEVQNVLSEIFKTAEKQRRIVDEIVISGIEDTGNIKLADAVRLNVKNARIAAEKVFDMKRSEVQTAMNEYKLEDKLWLRAKQTMQDLLKSVEETAKYKSETIKRYEIEQRELRTSKRAFEISKYADIDKLEFENMTDESFEVFLSGLKSEYEAKIAAEKKAEQERLEAERLEAERIEKQRLENERLKAEAEAREKELIAERKKQSELQAKKDAELKKEREENARVRAELQAKKDAELKAERERLAAEKAEKIEAEKNAKAPVKKQLENWVNLFSYDTPPVENEQTALIIQKFESFKKWAKSEIEKI